MKHITTPGVTQVSGNDRCTMCSACGVPRRMSLKAQLDAYHREYEANAAPDLVDAMRRSIRQLAETGLAAKAIKAGETGPPFRLRCRRGGFVSLSDLLNRGPVVVSFFWGDWCPFCVLELTALAAACPEIEHLGATLIALSPQDLKDRASLAGTAKLPFPILWDAGCKIASRYRIAFTIPERYRAAYRAQGYQNSPMTSWALPIPATYVLDRTGIIVLAYLDTDHTTRLEPAAIIAALSHLRALTIPGRNKG